MNFKHGCTRIANRTRESSTWRAHICWVSLRARCDKPKWKDYPNYGGRGITYDPAWAKFETFLADMGLPSEGMTIERVDNDGPYCKANCIWADRTVQSRNRRNKRLIVFDGKSMRIREWAQHLGVPVTTIKNRVYRGWPLERALTV